jgi:hypothetical protein
VSRLLRQEVVDCLTAAEAIHPASVDGWECPGCGVVAIATKNEHRHGDDCPVAREPDDICAADASWGETHPWASVRRRRTVVAELINPVNDGRCQDPDQYPTTVVYTDEPGIRLRWWKHQGGDGSEELLALVIDPLRRECHR